MTFHGHVIRKDELEKVVLTEYVEGTRDRGKQRETFLTYLSKHKGIQSSEMIRQVIDRDMWIQLCRTWQSTSKDMTVNDDESTMFNAQIALSLLSITF